MTPSRKDEPDEDLGFAQILVRMGHEDGGRVNPDRILRRKPTSRARLAFMEAQDAGWLDGSGWVTEAGRAMLRDSDA